MSERTFILCLAGLAGLVLISGTEFPGAMIGFFAGIAIAFFVAGPTFLVTAALRKAGLPIEEIDIVYGLVTVYGLLTLLLCLWAWRAWQRDDAGFARACTAKAATFLALPLIFYLSSQALVRAWP